MTRIDPEIVQRVSGGSAARELMHYADVDAAGRSKDWVEGYWQAVVRHVRTRCPQAMVDRKEAE